MSKRTSFLRSGILLLTLALIVFALASCSKQGANQADGTNTSGEPIKIGAVFSVTGPASPLGTPERDTAQLVEDQINKSGGIDGRPVEIIVMDDKSAETECVMAMKKLIDQGVVAIVGPTLTGTSLASVDTINQQKIPLVSCAAGIQIVQPVNEWIFKTAQSDAHAVAKLIDYMKAKGIKNVAMINDSNAFGTSGKEQLAAQAPAAGIKVVATESFGTKDTDMTAQLTRIKGKNPDAVICWGTNPGPATVAKNVKQLGMKMPLLMSHGIANKTFIDLAGKAADGVVFPAGRLLVADEISDDDPQKSVLLDYRKAFDEKFTRAPDTFGGHAWDALMMLAEAIEEVGTDPVKLRDRIEATKGFVGIGGVFTFTPEEHNGLTKDAFVMVTIADGSWKLVK